MVPTRPRELSNLASMARSAVGSRQLQNMLTTPSGLTIRLQPYSDTAYLILFKCPIYGRNEIFFHFCIFAKIYFRFAAKMQNLLFSPHNLLF
jgi:hypothetical protein